MRVYSARLPVFASPPLSTYIHGSLHAVHYVTVAHTRAPPPRVNESSDYILYCSVCVCVRKIEKKNNNNKLKLGKVKLW